MANYPTSVTSFTTKTSGQTIAASHVNDAQDEINAIESALLNGLAHHTKPSATNTYDLGVSGAIWRDLFIGRIGYVNDTSNANMTTGLTINQGAADNESLALKSSDSAHGMTTHAETDTYAAFTKAVGADGGLAIQGLSDDVIGLDFQGLAVSAATAKTTAADGAVELRARLKSGTDVTVLGADGNLAVIKNNTTTRFIFDAEGSAHADVEWVAFDTHNDLALLDTLDTTMSVRDAVTNAFGEMLAYQAPALQAAGIVTFYDDGPRAMVNFTRLAMLHTGALRQVGRQLAALSARVDRLLPEGA